MWADARNRPRSRTANREICARIGPKLREAGQVFVGIDVIGEWLTEINVTSPTGLQELERFDGTNAARLYLGRHRGATGGLRRGCAWRGKRFVRIDGLQELERSTAPMPPG